MGVDAVVIVENNRNLTVDAFVAKMNADPWGKRYAFESSGEPAWTFFEWEGKAYFSLTSGYPRYMWLFEDEWDFERDKRYPNPRFSYRSQVGFCKAMQVAERIAGGPVFLGNDVIYARTPGVTHGNETFMLPPELDVMLGNWRAIAALPITPEELYKDDDDK
jgi:hypothetical protein